ncbi:MAG: HlyD family type I secretion periplasmic adaptor subunit [Alphaproteobacteria bacterium]
MVDKKTPPPVENKAEQKAALKKPQAQKPPADDNITINDAPEWENVQANWAKEKANRMKAHAMRVFDTDEDVPLSKHFLLLFIVVFWMLFIIWANFAPLDEVTRGEGKIIPSTNVQALQSLEAGIVDEFLVREGDRVEKGQVLLRLNQIEAASDLGANKARYLGLLASITRLQAEAEGKGTVEFPEDVIKGAPQSVTEELNAFRANRQQLQGQKNIFQQQLMQREQEVRELNTRIADTRGVIGLQRQEMEMIEPLVARGSAPKLELLQLERVLKEKNTELNGYLSSLPRARSAAGEVRARLKDLDSTSQADAQTELSAKLIEMNEIKERLSAMTERKDRTDIRSPVSGTIQEITTNTVGGVVRPGEDIIKIVPEDDKLIVEAEVRPSDRAFIYPGQKAIVKLTAYDFAIYGGLDAELTDISADTFEDQEGNVFYKVKLTTKETELKRKGEVLPIEVGMVASVDILTGEKTVMQYLLKPFFKTLDTAMRER